MMDEIAIMERITKQWQFVEHQKQLNQDLYDLLGDSIFYLLRYAEKNNILLPNRDALLSMVDRIHTLMNKIDTTTTPIGTTLNEHPDKEHYQKPGSVPFTGVPIGLFG